MSSKVIATFFGTSGTLRMSRKTYRKNMSGVFEPLRDQDVFHVIATGNGGADHHDNYDYVRSRSWNMMIGTRYDHVNCFLAGYEKSKRAIEASMEIGSYTDKDPRHTKYTGPGAEELCERGEKAMRLILQNL